MRIRTALCSYWRSDERTVLVSLGADLGHTAGEIRDERSVAADAGDIET